MYTQGRSYNLYCDESGHLLNMQQEVMVLGALMLPRERVTDIASDLKQIKRDHELSEHWELKWTKLSESKLAYYKDLINYFVDDRDLRFRCVVVADKNKLDHMRFERTHDDFYYVMFYYALRELIVDDGRYDIYFDYKDTHQNEKLAKLKKYLLHKCNVSKVSIELRVVQSHESQLIQLTDFLQGIVAYSNKNLGTSHAKSDIVNYAQNKIGVSFNTSTYRLNKKFNVFKWNAR